VVESDGCNDGCCSIERDCCCVVDRLDQTLGKPSIWMLSSEREKQRMTIVSRLSRVELQVSCTMLTVHFNITCSRVVSTLLYGKPSKPMENSKI